jgi:hypothetical protein
MREHRILLLDYGRTVLEADAWKTMPAYRDDMERMPDSILYIETDIPPQMTFSDWRRSKAHAPRRRLISRLRARRAAAALAQRTS